MNKIFLEVYQFLSEITDEQIEKEMVKKIKKAEKILKYFHLANASLLFLPLPTSPIVILNFILARLITAAILRLTAPCSIYLTKKKYNKVKYYQCNVNAYKLIIEKLKSERIKCVKNKKPVKCRKIIDKQLIRLKQLQDEFYQSIIKERNRKRYGEELIQ